MLTDAFVRTEFRAPLQLLECDLSDSGPCIRFLMRLELPRHACQEIEIILRGQGLRCLLRSFELHQDDKDLRLFRQPLVDQELVFDPHDLEEESSFIVEEIADGDEATLEAMCEHAVDLAALRRVYFDLPSYAELHARRARKANRRKYRHGKSRPALAG